MLTAGAGWPSYTRPALGFFGLFGWLGEWDRRGDLAPDLKGDWLLD